MRVTLDGREISADAVSISAGLDAGRDAAAAAGRIVIEARGDGSPLDDETLADPPHEKAGIEELSLVSADRGSFVSVTLTDTKPALSEARELAQVAAAAIQEDRLGDVQEPLSRVLSLWTVVRDVVHKSGHLLERDPARLEFSGPDGSRVSGAACIDGLAENLTELKRGLTDQDWGAVSDVLAYDLSEQATRWESFLDAMAAAAEGDQAGEESGGGGG